MNNDQRADLMTAVGFLSMAQGVIDDLIRRLSYMDGADDGPVGLPTPCDRLRDANDLIDEVMNALDDASM